MVHLLVITARYGESQYKSVYTVIFKFVWLRASKQYFNNQDHSTEGVLLSDIDPNMPKRLLRP